MPPSTGNLLAFRPAAPAEPAYLPGLLLGPSAAVSRVWSQVRRMAPYFRTALLCGERGAGHAAAAHALHRLSPRSDRPLVTIKASEADVVLAGVATRFSGETLFFPDVHLLSAQAQSSLLRIIRLRRPHQVCVIAATTADLRAQVSAGVFCAMLAPALTALPISLPSLGERAEDIPALATHILTHEARTLSLTVPTMSTDLLEALAQQDWPGNLDQMQSTLRRLLQSPTPESVDELPQYLAQLMEEDQNDSTACPRFAHPEPVRMLKLDDVVQAHIRAVLVGCNGNKLRAAEVLGISRSTLYRMLDTSSALAIAV